MKHSILPTEARLLRIIGESGPGTRASLATDHRDGGDQDDRIGQRGLVFDLPRPKGTVPATYSTTAMRRYMITAA